MSDLRFLQELAGEFDRVRVARAARRCWSGSRRWSWWPSPLWC
jgi:hypothetical protein